MGLNMGQEIIAEKFALIRTKGSNGVAFTHLVEDTLTGERAIVKITESFDSLAFDYLKSMNLLKACELPGFLLPSEGGILEEEDSFYLVFPELGAPSLENFLRIGVPLSSKEALGIIKEILFFVEKLHAAGFCHLFINPRNIFYRSRGSITLKDPALKSEFFQPLLEVIAGPDFSYFSPRVMDGEEPDPHADIYAIGRVAERLLEEVTDCDSTYGKELLSVAESCLSRGSGHVGMGACGGTLLGVRAPAEKAGPLGAGEIRCIEVLAEASEAGGGTSARANGKSSLKAVFARSLRSVATILLLALLAAGLVAAAMSFDSSGRIAVDAELQDDEGGMPANDLGTAAGSAAEGADENQAVSAEGSRQAADAVIILEENQQSPPDRSTAAPAGSPGPEARPRSDTSPDPPVASFSISPSSGQSPLQVCLDASASYDPDGHIVSYSWSCGAQGKTVYHIFESNVVPTTLCVTLTVTDDAGHASSTTRQVTLY